MDILYPPVCAVCGERLEPHERQVCVMCRYTAPLTGYWNNEKNPLTEQFFATPAIEQASALLFYRLDSDWRRLIHDFKYRQRWALAEELGRWYGRLLAEGHLYDDIDLIIPLPLHPLRLLMRGYNQSFYLAKGISHHLHARVDTRSVRRVRYTRSQTRLSRLDRSRNVASAFRVTDGEALRGRHLLLVDDVLTTGSTVEACADAILQAVPDCRISVAVLALPPQTKRG